MALGNSYNNITFLAWRQMSAVRNPALCNACWERAEHLNATGQAAGRERRPRTTPCRFIPSEAGAKQRNEVHAHRRLPKRCPQYTIQIQRAPSHKVPTAAAAAQRGHCGPGSAPGQSPSLAYDRRCCLPENTIPLQTREWAQSNHRTYLTPHK